MIKLKNIEKSENIVKCDIFPEDSVSGGMLIYDIAADSIKDFELPEGYEWCKNHLSHAVKAIRNMVETNTIQNEKTIMWG